MLEQQAAQQNDEERRRLEEEQRRQAEQAAAQQAAQAAQQIPVLQKPEADPVAGPQGQRIKYYDEGGVGVQRRGEGITPENMMNVGDRYRMLEYSAGMRNDYNDPIVKQARANDLVTQLNALRESLNEKEADIAAGQQKEYYEDWAPEELSRAYEAELMRQAWRLDPARNPYPAQYEMEHYHGNGARDVFGRLKG